MKRLILVIICGFTLSACGPRGGGDAGLIGGRNSVDADTIEYPMLIEDSTKIVYQFGRMTPDKGLRVYVDTIPYSENIWSKRDSLRRLLSNAPEK